VAAQRHWQHLSTQDTRPRQTKHKNRTQHRKLKRLATWPHQKPGGGEPVQLTLILFFVW
jgi:hypothetical protein